MLSTTALTGLRVSVYAAAGAQDPVLCRDRSAWTAAPSATACDDLSDVVVFELTSESRIVAKPLAAVLGLIPTPHFGGRFVYACDSRFRRVSEFPVPLLDSECPAVPAPADVNADGSISVDVIFSPFYRRCAFDGPTTTFDRVRLYADCDPAPSDSIPPDALVLTQHRSLPDYFMAVPARFRALRAHTMMGGNFVYSESPLFASKFGPYPVPVHDRSENANTRALAGYPCGTAHLLTA